MGGADKALLMLRGRTLIEHAVARASPQVGELLINANGDTSRFARLGLPIIADSIAGFLGPLAGILTGLEWMRANRPHARWLASFACDTPFFPADLVTSLIAAAEREQALSAIAASNGRQHNIFAVWNKNIKETADSILGKQALRKMEDFIQLLPHTSIEFPQARIDPFFNINSPEDLAHAEAMMAGEQPIR
jgi:molybdopterin-guanine dinucleotide biosynthesis protein A